MTERELADRYYLPPERRHALWENEIAMFIVLAMPLVVAAFWYGSTLQVIDIYGHLQVPASTSRGVGLALASAIIAAVAGATYLYVQPSAVRVRNAQPVRGPRRLAYAAFVGFLIAVNTSESLTQAELQTVLMSDLIGIALGAVAALIAYVAMRSMVDIEVDEKALALASSVRVRGAR